MWHGETYVKQQDFFQLVYIVCAHFLTLIRYIISYFLYAYYIKARSSSFMVQLPFPGHVMTVGDDAVTLENMACSASLGRNTTILMSLDTTSRMLLPCYVQTRYLTRCIAI